jgi:hypothetical protein
MLAGVGMATAGVWTFSALGVSNKLTATSPGIFLAVIGLVIAVTANPKVELNGSKGQQKPRTPRK